MRSTVAKLGCAAVALVAAFGIASVAEAPFALIPQKPSATTVLFFGDMMLDRGVARRAEGDGMGLVAGVKNLAKDADLVVLNLEGTITTEESIAARNNKILRFTFNPALAQSALHALGVDAVSLANNHALDFYAAGYKSTRAYLADWGIASFGHPLNVGELSTVLVHGDFRLCLVGYHELFDAATATILEEIARIRPNCDRVVVVPHWGIEYESTPSLAQREEARAFIDAGADVVVGAHPHVIQPHEIYQGKAIFYSLGNFVFDQDFSPETKRGLALKIEFGKEETTFTRIPLAIVESRPTPDGALDSFRLP